MKTFLMVAASLTMIAAGLGVLASIPAESLPMAGASVFVFLLGGILWALADISITLAAATPKPEAVRSETAPPAPIQYAPAIPEPARDPKQTARHRRFVMVMVVVGIIACCAIVFLSSTYQR